ncbi:MAG TPA: FAD:protein FMN transferase, partial [Spirochaetota bacterium]|nr:FAD:protein FMN transferase [Spirochaetota bacterium]
SEMTVTDRKEFFDPKTGYPSKNSLRSVTVISDSPVKCDALSTALFVMGSEEGLNFLEKNEKTEGIFIENDENNYKVVYSSGIKADKNETGTWDFVLRKEILTGK